MEKINDNMWHNDRDDEIVVLGKASVETMGRAGSGEPIGALVLPGIAED